MSPYVSYGPIRFKFNRQMTLLICDIHGYIVFLGVYNSVIRLDVFGPESQYVYAAVH
jgi:hypothetical protein